MELTIEAIVSLLSSFAMSNVIPPGLLYSMSPEVKKPRLTCPAAARI
jgi:hypothetical protein